MATTVAAKREKRDNDLQRILKAITPRIISLPELRALISALREHVRLPSSFGKTYAVLSEVGGVTEVRLPFPRRDVIRYCLDKEVALYDLVQSISSDGYFSHFSAIFIHGLTLQIPKTLYFNIEQPKRPSGSGLSQESLNRAFSGKPRTTNNIAVFGDRRICIVEGAQTGRLGVQEIKSPESEALIYVSDIERTLIDATVRPVYSGGSFEVANVFRRAVHRASGQRIADYLQQIGYTYPYHQAIGFYMQNAGFPESELHPLRQLPITFDFYLDYGIKQKAFDSRWKVFYPKVLK